MESNLVIFFHRQGTKLFQVSKDEKVVEIIDIDSINPSDIIENLSTYFGNSFYLLVSDAICHVFHHEVPHQDGHLSREFIFEQVKDKLPSHLQSSSWDFKVISTNASTIEVIVFAISSEYQSIISSVISKLNARTISVEPESISVTRHPNPIVGITFSKVNPVHVPTVTPISSPPKLIVSTKPPLKKVLGILLGVILFVLINLFLTQKYNQKYGENTTVLTIPTITIIPTPTIIQKPWSSISLLIENGTSKSGYAGSIAVKFEEEGVVNVKTGNASRNDYTTSILTFKNNALKEAYYQRLNNIFPVGESSVQINPDSEIDVVLTLGNL